MKKLLIVFLALILILGGLFFWKGGHHAIFLAGELEEWFDTDNADQSLTIQINKPTFGLSKDGDTIEPEVDLLTLTADTFWTEYGDDRVFGLSAGDYTAYVRGRNLYMDTGNAYSLPSYDGIKEQLRKLALGFLLHGRITKDGTDYQFSMERKDVSVSGSIVMDPVLRCIRLSSVFPLEGIPFSLQASLTPRQTEAHSIPQTVADAMVRASIEAPMPLSEPLNLLLPALQTLFPLRADVTLGVECGILSLSETVGLSVEDGKAELTRSGSSIPLDLPEEILNADPVLLSFVFLRSANFIRNGENAEFRVTLPPEATSDLISQFVPQLAGLGVTFEQSDALISISGEKMTAVQITANGTVPFLITTIPLTFSAELHIT